ADRVVEAGDRGDPDVGRRRRHRSGVELRARDAHIGGDPGVGIDAAAAGDQRECGQPLHSWISARSVTASSPRLVGTPLMVRPLWLMLWSYSRISRPWLPRSAAAADSVVND